MQPRLAPSGNPTQQVLSSKRTPKRRAVERAGKRLKSAGVTVPSSVGATRDPPAFLPGVSEHLGYYVYALIDPRNEAIFYVGKGKGDRVYQHARHAKKVARSESRAELKLGRIQDIHHAGFDVRVELVRHGLTENV